jgi:microcin C transport system substrate-binding protein
MPLQSVSAFRALARGEEFIGMRVSASCGLLAGIAMLLAVVPLSAVHAEFVSPASGITYYHGISYLREPSYPADFAHLRYVDPHAPKGGRIRIGEMGNWDSFSDVPVSGRPVAGISVSADSGSLIYDSLLSHAIDTVADRYGRLAKGVAVADNGAWIAFYLRDGARWHDGYPVTVDDFAFTFDVYKRKANPTIRLAMAPFERFEIVNEREIRYWVQESVRQQPDLVLRIGAMAVLPEHYWQDRDITRATLQPPLGSGPYRVKSHRSGRQITYERVPDYWGRDLPVNRGRYNFDEIVYDYFRDDQVLYEAAKGDLIDIREETVPVRWATGYDTPAARRGDLVLEPTRLLRPAGMWWPIFWNLRDPKFRDVRVREALYLLRDGDWANRVLSHDFWDNPSSFFHDSEFSHRGTPSPRELEFLEPIRHLVPPRVFTEEFTVPPQGEGWSREHVLKALALFRQSGWVVRDNVLVHAETGEPFAIRLLAVSPALASSFIPYIQVLKRAGIRATVSSPEISSWLHRSRTGDFDGGALWFLPDNSPALLVSSTFSSHTIGEPYSPNWAGIQDPAVDKLIGDMEQARTWDDFVAALRALDRVLMWNFYYAPTMSRTKQGIVYWNRFGRAEHGRLVRSAAVDTWWWDAEKAATVARRQGSRS